jgi:hypothetical protein
MPAQLRAWSLLYTRPASAAAPQFSVIVIPCVGWLKMHFCFGCVQVRVLGDESNIFKYLLRDSSKWEVARPPNEVSSSCKCPLPLPAQEYMYCFQPTAC